MSVIYVDGFNLYYEVLKNTACKWLDLQRFFTLLRQNDDIRAIKYFTAIVEPGPRRRTWGRSQVWWRRTLSTRDE